MQTCILPSRHGVCHGGWALLGGDTGPPCPCGLSFSDITGGSEDRSASTWPEVTARPGTPNLPPDVALRSSSVRQALV